ncbi:hypothetical protein FH972_025484 [Carpinus fangiana]|uniref:alpha-1,2-Mannosidase n=1 Tax=Carpinus fangiana TaxID=176857 RepID=A0A5N6L1K2_9ROSI|nr:hypothetical protein FH972_025484 [Carpinus fangiana]
MGEVDNARSAGLAISPTQESTLAKRKRVDSDDVDIHVKGTKHVAVSSRGIQPIINDIWDILQSYDSTHSILDRISSSLSPTINGDKSLAKRQKLSESTSTATIIEKVEQAKYTSLQDFEADLRAASLQLLSSLTSPSPAFNGKPSWIYQNTPREQEQRQVIAQIKALQELGCSLIAAECAASSKITSQASHVKNEDMDQTRPSDVDHAIESGKTVLTLYGNAQGHKQLFSSLQRPLAQSPNRPGDSSQTALEQPVIPLRENGLPNNIFSTKVVPVAAEDVASTRKGLTFGDVFATPPSIPQLQPPKSRNGQARGDSLSWAKDKPAQETRRLGHTFEKLPAGQWLGYGGVVQTQEPTSPEAKRKRRDRALSTGEAVLAPSESAKAAQMQAKEDALFRSAYSSFAPSRDNGGVLISEEDKSQIWWERHGRDYFDQLFAYPLDGVVEGDPTLHYISEAYDEEADIAQAIQEFEPADFEASLSIASREDRETEEILSEISEMLETLHSHQRIRNLSLSGNPKSSISPSTSLNDLTGTPSTPSTAEMLLHDTLKQQLALMISMLPPYAVCKLNGNQMEELYISRHLPFEDSDYRGVMDEDQASRLARQAALQAAVGTANGPPRPLATPGSFSARPSPMVAAQPGKPTGASYNGYPQNAASRGPSYARQPLSSWQPQSQQGYHRSGYSQTGYSPQTPSSTQGIPPNRGRPSSNTYSGGRPLINGYSSQAGQYQARPASQSHASTTSGFGMGSPMARHGSPQGYQAPTPQMTRPGSNQSQYSGHQSPPQPRPGSSYMSHPSPSKAAPGTGYLTPTASSVNSAGDTRNWRSSYTTVTSFTQKSRAQAEQAILQSLSEDATLDREAEIVGVKETDLLDDGLTEDFPHISIPGPKDAKQLQSSYSSTSDPPKIHPTATERVPLNAAAYVGTKTSTIRASSSQQIVHWSSQAEKYPVTSTITLPSGKPTPIPKIQATVTEEDPASRKTRESRRDTIKTAFQKHWTGYKKFAWGHDELRPISEGFHDPFAGWGATLVDSLDTLWIMGLKDEFEEAVKATTNIDFTTTELKTELPLFEVTIRYLGGLLSAYDLSGAQYPVLLEKAVELGEILYGAFDTENRMPMTYFKWQPENVKRFHKAGHAVVLAELGTLSMEFTRLSQLTKEPKYYDAVARITDAFYEFQNRTALPGMWPLYVDATGCENTESSLSASAKKYGYTRKGWGGALPSKQELSFSDQGSQDPTDDTPSIPDNLGNMQAGHAKVLDTSDALRKRANDEESCEQTGLQSSSGGADTFTLGGMADSVYEYLPKEYLLLGTGNNQYREMHERAMDPIKEYTLYRPMIPDESRSLRFTGKYTTDSFGREDDDSSRHAGSLDTSTGHLSCFIGAVVGLGAKIFDRPSEMELAEQLTDACVWAYEITATGIMAEDISPIACDKLETCKWNETKWHHEIAPYAEEMVEREWTYYEEQVKKQDRHQSQATTTENDLLESPPLAVPDVKLSDFDKRQLDEEALEEFTGSAEDVAKDTIPAKTAPISTSDTDPDLARSPEAIDYNPPPPEKPKTLEQYFSQKIADDRLAPGIARWGGKNYILRPEAIESVFYMYRLTGNKTWQDKGWVMWKAIEKHTSVENGNSAISDVTSTVPNHKDSAESFWTGETLKYFYLLYSEPGLVSLDDYVLNTEAHPFLRPDAKVKRSGM